MAGTLALGWQSKLLAKPGLSMWEKARLFPAVVTTQPTKITETNLRFESTENFNVLTCLRNFRSHWPCLFEEKTCARFFAERCVLITPMRNSVRM